MKILILYIFLFTTIIFYIVKLFNEAKLKKLSNISTPKIKKSHLKLKNNKGASLLMIAASKNNYKLVKKLIIDFNANINEVDYDNNNALIYAIENNCERVISFLIENGIDVNIVNDSVKSPVYFAITQNNGKLLELLINNGADLEFKGKKGFNFLKYAKFIEADNCIDLLANRKVKKETDIIKEIKEKSAIEEVISESNYQKDTNVKIQINDNYCFNCGSKLDSIYKFCPSCGINLKNILYKKDVIPQKHIRLKVAHILSLLFLFFLIIGVSIYGGKIYNKKRIERNIAAEKIRIEHEKKAQEISTLTNLKNKVQEIVALNSLTTAQAEQLYNEYTDIIGVYSYQDLFEKFLELKEKFNKSKDESLIEYSNSFGFSYNLLFMIIYKAILSGEFVDPKSVILTDLIIPPNVIIKNSNDNSIKSFRIEEAIKNKISDYSYLEYSLTVNAKNSFGGYVGNSTMLLRVYSIIGSNGIFWIRF